MQSFRTIHFSVFKIQIKIEKWLCGLEKFPEHSRNEPKVQKKITNVHEALDNCPFLYQPL